MVGEETVFYPETDTVHLYLVFGIFIISLT